MRKRHDEKPKAVPVKANVTIGVACGTARPDWQRWWAHMTAALLYEQKNGVNIVDVLAVASMLPDRNKNETISSNPFTPEDKRRDSLTDANRVAVTTRFLDGEGEWLVFIDDDTVPPVGFISTMLKTGHKFVSGLYVNPAPPHNVIAYLRDPLTGRYRGIYDVPEGTISFVDSVGMGCALIHRDVFLKIQENYTVFERYNGSLVPIHNEDIRMMAGFLMTEENIYIDAVKFPGGVVFHEEGGKHMLLTPIHPLSPGETDNRSWPFFALEYGRTEDHAFCEMAKRVGFPPLLDTTVKCKHIKSQDYTDKDRIEYVLNQDTKK